MKRKEFLTLLIAIICTGLVFFLHEDRHAAEHLIRPAVACGLQAMCTIAAVVCWLIIFEQ